MFNIAVINSRTRTVRRLVLGRYLHHILVSELRTTWEAVYADLQGRKLVPVYPKMPHPN